MTRPEKMQKTLDRAKAIDQKRLEKEQAERNLSRRIARNKARKKQKRDAEYLVGGVFIGFIISMIIAWNVMQPERLTERDVFFLASYHENWLHPSWEVSRVYQNRYDIVIEAKKPARKIIVDRWIEQGMNLPDMCPPDDWYLWHKLPDKNYSLAVYLGDGSGPFKCPKKG